MNALATVSMTHAPRGTRHTGTDRLTVAAAAPISLFRTLSEGAQP